MSKYVIPGIIPEEIIGCMNEDDFTLFASLLDDSLAQIVKKYTTDPASNHEYVTILNNAMGDLLDSYTYHLELRESGVLELLHNLQPETILRLEPGQQDVIYKQLKVLQDNEYKLRSSLPARDMKSFDKFVSVMTTAAYNLSLIDPSFEPLQFKEVLKANKSIFVMPREKNRILPTSFVIRSKSRWLEVIQTIDFDRYCTQHGIDYAKRYVFI